MVGWSYDGQREFFTKEELCELFSLEKINKAPGVFDYKKLDWYNGMYIRQKSDEELTELLVPYLQEATFVSEVPTVDELAMVKAIVPVVKERLKVLEDVVEMSRFLFTEIDVPQSSSLIPKKQDAKTTLEVLKQVVPIIKKMANTADEVIEEELVALANGLEIKVNGVFMPIRVAVTGSTISPPLFDSIRLLGLDTAVARLERAISTLENEVA
jgi:glutamyl-tRNA synthetase